MHCNRRQLTRRRSPMARNRGHWLSREKMFIRLIFSFRSLCLKDMPGEKSSEIAYFCGHGQRSGRRMPLLSFHRSALTHAHKRSSLPSLRRRRGYSTGTRVISLRFSYFSSRSRREISISPSERAMPPSLRERRRSAWAFTSGKCRLHAEE